MDTLEVAVIRCEFDLPPLTENTNVPLRPKSLGEEQAIYINGTLIASQIKRDDPIREDKLNQSMLHVGKNAYALVCKPLVKRFQYDNLNTDPGIVQVSNPAETWKRTVFNGMAQVIILSTKELGTIVLNDVAKGLNAASIQIYSQ